jgi:uncharacterized membrane protein HdeD (DUF308 family)
MATFIQAKYIGGNLHDEVFVHSKWLRFAGFVLLCLGLATIVAPFMPAMHSAAVLCGLLATSGVMYMAHAIAFWRQRWIGFTLHILAGLIYLTAGYSVFIYPLADIRILAEILIASYLIVGLFRITIALGQGLANLGWSWTFICGIINIALTYFIWTQLDTISSGLLALVIGIELAFTGLALFMLGVNARRELQAR